MTSPKQHTDAVQQHTEAAAQQAVLGNFQLTATLPQGKSIVMSGYLLSGESVESLNQRLDLMHGVMDRQRTIAEIPELEMKLDVTVKRLEDLRRHYAELEKKKASGKQLSTQEKQTLNVMDTNVDYHVKDIEKGRAAIAEAKAKVGLA